MGMEGRQRLFNPPKFFDGEHLHGQGDADLMLRGGPVYWVRKEFCLCGNQMRRHGFFCKYRSESLELVLKIRVLFVLDYMIARMFRQGNVRDMVRRTYVRHLCISLWRYFYNVQATEQLAADQILVTCIAASVERERGV
jgi:hypothetical protein